MTKARLLFVCSGNTCRSPLAEAIARKMAEEKGWSELKILSAGTGASGGSLASSGALAAARRHGLELDSHRSIGLTSELVEWADLVLTMGPEHRRRAEDLGGVGKSRLLKAYAEGRAPSEEDGARDGVPDPFGGDDEMYEKTFQTLEHCVELALDRMKVEWSS